MSRTGVGITRDINNGDVRIDAHFSSTTLALASPAQQSVLASVRDGATPAEVMLAYATFLVIGEMEKGNG